LKNLIEGGVLLFGIDNNIIGNLKMSKAHDFDKLFSHSNVERSVKGDTMTLYDENTGEEIKFSSITITKDERFRSLSFGCKTVKSGPNVEYVKLDVFVSEPGGHNLVPLSKSEMMLKHDTLMIYIKEKYGLNIDNSEAKYNFIEINNTIEVDYELKEYHYVFELIHDIAPARYKRVIKEMEAKSKDLQNEIRSIVYENGSMKIKIYNKTKQLEQELKIIIEKRCVRIEVCLKDAKKVKAVFGTNYVSEISDEMLKEYYLKVVTEDIFNRIDEYIKKANKELKKELKIEKKAEPKKYPKLYLKGVCGLKYKKTGLDLVFDIEQVLEILKNDVSRWDRTYKTLVNEVDKRPHKKNNLARYNEIKQKTLDLN
jgi:hypothetical protein